MNPGDDADDRGPQDIGGAVAQGAGILRWTWIGVAVFVLVGTQATIQPTHAQYFVAVSLVEFLVGMVVFAWAFLRAVDRSRTEAIGIGGLFFASGSAPRRVQLVLVGSVIGQSIAAVVFASVRPYTPSAFGVLAPMWALGFTGLWVARHGSFPSRTPEPTRAARRAAARDEHRRAAAPRSAADGE